MVLVNDGTPRSGAPTRYRRGCRGCGTSCLTPDERAFSFWTAGRIRGWDGDDAGRCMSSAIRMGRASWYDAAHVAVLGFSKTVAPYSIVVDGAWSPREESHDGQPRGTLSFG